MRVNNVSVVTDKEGRDEDFKCSTGKASHAFTSLKKEVCCFMTWRVTKTN